MIRNPSAMNWFRTIKRSLQPDHAAIVVYDITKRFTFERAKHEVDGCTALIRPGAFVALVGNKAGSRREVSFEVSMRSCFYDSIVLHVLNMKSRRKNFVLWFL